MATNATLQADKREVKGTSASKRLRREGIVPGVVYGSKQDEYAIQLNAKTFADVAKKQSSTNFLVNLEIAGAKEKTKLAFVQEIQKEPISGQLLHVDFRAVNEGETINAVVPIVLTGEPIGVKSGGLLEQLVRSIEISCLPADLPASVEMSVEPLNVGDSLKVADLELGEGVSTRLNGDVLVALVAQTRASVSAGASGGGDAAGEAAAAE